MPQVIDASRFPNKYFFQLVNDVAAAKSFLDSRNDSGELNSSDIYVVGAGEGATIGALWMASEFSRKRIELQSSPATTKPSPGAVTCRKAAVSPLPPGLWRLWPG